MYARRPDASKSRPNLRILMYHAIGTSVDGDSFSIYSLSPAAFRKQVSHLASNSRITIRPLASEQLCESGIAVTFDDGYADLLTTVAPILGESGVPFTAFISTAAVAERRPGFLSPEQLRELDSVANVQIGSHGVNHVRLTQCAPQILKQELEQSKAFLEDLLGHPITCLSYPHGAVDARVKYEAQAAGYLLGATSRFGTNLAGRDPLLLCRTDVWATDDEKTFGDWDWMRWRHRDPAKRG
jgi:peptidoglycan/xylan/chitin deacetylase (PgdA/CDA1 family)